MLRVSNHNTRILLYAGIVFASLSVAYFLAHQASCLSDRGSWFCGGGSLLHLLIIVFAMTPGGTILALAVAERNLYDTMGMVILGFMMLLFGFGIAGLMTFDWD